MIKLLPRRDKYALWYFDSDGTREESSLSISRDGTLMLGHAPILAKASFSRFFEIKPTPLIIALHPSYAWSVTVPILREAARGRDDISSEYKELVGHFLERSILDYRPHAAKAMGVHELDAVAANAYVRTLPSRIGSSKKRNGTTKKSLSREMLCLTFVTRRIFDALTPTLQSRKEVFFTDAWRSEALMVGEAMSYPIHYIVLHKDGSYRYTLGSDDDVVSMRERFPWRTEMPVMLLAQSWGLTAQTSNALFRKYYHEQFSSPRVHAFFSQSFSPARQSFFDAIASSRIGGAIWVRGTAHMPFSLPIRYRRMNIAPIQVRDIFQKLGITVRAFEKNDDETIFSRIAPFVEYDRFCRTPDALHQFLQRRIHWMFSR